MLTEYMRSHGGILSRASLAAAGVDDDLIRRAVRMGELTRVRRGWYSVPGAHPDAVRAVAAGGRVTCGSALALFGIWCFDVPELHVAVDPGARRRAVDVHFHSARLRTTRGASPAVDSPLEALERLARCAPRIGFLVAADSALNRGLVTHDQLRRALGDTTRGGRLLAAIDGGCESGIETIVRVALRSRRVRRRPQIEIAGVGRVDLVVGDRLVIESDGFQWHRDRRAFEEDRRRDLALAARGYIVVRLTFERVLTSWNEVETELLALIRRDEHLWSARHRALGHVPRRHSR